MASYMPNTLSGFHPATQALGGLAKAMFDPSYEIAGQQARLKADIGASTIAENNANIGKLNAAADLDRQKFGGRAGLEGVLAGAFNPDGSVNPQKVGAVLGALSQGDQLANSDKVFSLSQLFALQPGDAGYDDAARRSLIAGGHMPTEDFAATAGRADAVSARDAAEAYAQAVRVQGMQDATSITNNQLDNQTQRYGYDTQATTSRANNTADNARAVLTNTADNVQSGANNAADNLRAKMAADADRQIDFDVEQDKIAADTAKGQKPLYTAFSDPTTGQVYTFDTHAATPEFVPADGIIGLNKIGTPGSGPAAKTYQVSPSQLLDFQDGIQTEASGRELEPLQGDVLTTVQARAAELYSQAGSPTAGNAVGSIAAAFDELVQAEGGFTMGYDNAVLKAPPMQPPGTPTPPAMPSPPTQADILEAQQAIAAGADAAAVAQRFKKTFGVELQ